MSDKTYELEQRAERIADAIAKLSSQIQQIESQGEVAPAGCCVLRYQARGRRGTYWYYKLHAQEAIFLARSGEMSKYKHLGKAGSAAHIEAVLQVARRTQIEGLQRMLAALTQCWSELYDSVEGQGQRTSKK